MIQLKNISYTYPAGSSSGELKNISLTIPEGEFVVLCGRSGCGKTTVTRLMNGLIPHFYEGELTGDVIVNGVRIKETELSETARFIGSVFQNPKSQFFHADTTGELAFGCENQAIAREEIRKRIRNTEKIFQLEKLMGRSIFELSGGEKQQIACGSVYAAEPQVYVLDEPSSSMDIRAIGRLKAILKKLKESGKTVVVSEHRLYYLMELADRFVYMEDGRITDSYTPKQLCDMDRDQREKMGLRVADLSEIAYMAEKSGNMQESKKRKREAAIRIENLRCVRGKQEVLDIQKLEIPVGAVTAIIGENGAGKTTLAECLAGLQKCKGTICIGGKQMNAKERTAGSFMVMQDVNHQLFCESVGEEISLGLSDQNRKRVPILLEQMGLSSFADRHPASLSGGQKQRVAICAAACAGKEVLFYDEPTSGLDYDNMNRLCGLIRKMVGNQLATMIITHDPELIAGCCTHVLHMEDGRVKAFYPLNGDGILSLKKFFME